MPYDFLAIKRSILTGSMYEEKPETKWLFLVMLFESSEGTLTATIPHLARISALSQVDVEAALEALQAPDPNSTSIEAGGRRIEPVPNARNTYRIVNFAKYNKSLVRGTKNKMGAVVDPDTGEQIPRNLPNGERNPAYDCRRKQTERAAKRTEQLSLEEKVHSVHFVHERKENQTKAKEEDPPTPPKGRRRGTTPKALQKGDPKNAETWDAFDAVYPRPSNGRKLERSDARLTWDLLAEDGEDMAKIVDGAKRYREWIDALKKREYVAMMTTWLNQRRWEESYAIDPSSEDGKRIQAEKEAETRERRSAHQAKFTPEYDAYVASLAEAGIAAPGFEEAWRKDAEAVLEKRKRMGMTGAVKMAEKNLSDPEAAREDQIRRWKELNAASIPDFWTWDCKHNRETRD